MFEPWEIEELTCITLFFESRYKEIFRSVRSGLDKDSPGNERSDTSYDPFDYEDDLEDPVAAVRDISIYRMPGFFLGTGSSDAFGLDTLDYGMVDGCEEWLFKEHRRDPLPFRGDRTMEPNGMYPPVAWTLLWLETYCNRVGV
ncbi:uncharacterized protein N7473_004146 [Penicillium subrubescens]|uniref:uncharacterized protein n=1 Tax=Penicillium subrubescens TaxID=1316194 RepID=UPI002545159B|nr:uncharacterized protein N7473_004146 [Penicillium subrubescens]KAJ5907230.1 hypothetical protein N7473_004146 [Penicillium subrubescens]